MCLMPLNKSAIVLIITVALLIVGNLIGAGILALPVQTGLSGLIPSLLAMVVVGGAMLYTAVILGREAADTREATFNFPSLYHRYLGPVGKWIAILANLLILYGLLTAYLTGATSIIVNLFHINIPSSVVMLVFFLLITAVTIGGMRTVEKYNAFLVILLFASFGLIIIIAGRHIQPQRLAFSNWLLLPVAVPVMVTAFHFHNIIPNICQRLDWKMPVIVMAMLIGMVIGYIMNALWVMVGIGSLPLQGSQVSIVAAFEQNLPATVPMSRIITSPIFITGSLIFALIAIATSYLANGLGLAGFIEDLMENHLHLKNKILDLAVTFGPPLIISLLYPDIFLKAINVVGGFGIVILFGILPSIIAAMKARSFGGRALGTAMLVLFSLFLLAETAQETGLLKINPETESWNTPRITSK
jgi:tyrosine-specific transport protein